MEQVHEDSGVDAGASGVSSVQQACSDSGEGGGGSQQQSTDISEEHGFRPANPVWIPRAKIIRRVKIPFTAS